MLQPDKLYTRTELEHIPGPRNVPLAVYLRNDPVAPDPDEVTGTAVLTRGNTIIRYLDRLACDEGYDRALIDKMSAEVQAARRQAKLIVEKAVADARAVSNRHVLDLVMSFPRKEFPLDQLVNHGVYFLFFKDELRYVGQSVNIAARVATHKHSGRIVFDRVEIFPCDREHFNDWEGLFIRLLCPPDNGYARDNSRKAGAPNSKFFDQIQDASYLIGPTDEDVT